MFGLHSSILNRPISDSPRLACPVDPIGSSVHPEQNNKKNLTWRHHAQMAPSPGWPSYLGRAYRTLSYFSPSSFLGTLHTSSPSVILYPSHSFCHLAPFEPCSIPRSLPYIPLSPNPLRSKSISHPEPPQIRTCLNYGHHTSAIHFYPVDPHLDYT